MTKSFINSQCVFSVGLKLGIVFTALIIPKKLSESKARHFSVLACSNMKIALISIFISFVFVANSFGCQLNDIDYPGADFKKFPNIESWKECGMSNISFESP